MTPRCLASRFPFGRRLHDVLDLEAPGDAEDRRQQGDQGVQFFVENTGALRR
jgi:hypothetical protein